MLRALSRVVEAGHRHGRQVSICGDAAADPKLLPFLIGVGFDAVSVEVWKLPAVHRIVASTSHADAVGFARQILTMGRIRDVEEALSRQGAPQPA